MTLNDPREAVGPDFSLAALRHARRRSWAALERIARDIRPGMREGQAVELADAILHDMGMERAWHPSLVRFGEGTLKTFRHALDPGRALRADDIFFLDLGPVWQGHEGDVGATFVVGDDPQMHACAAAGRTLWQETHAFWHAGEASGKALYAFAAERAAALGWRLDLGIRGHRVSDFPHAPHQGGDLGDFSAHPTAGRWILEIQIMHPERPFGAFHEDLLDVKEVS